MIVKYNLNVENQIINHNILRLINQLYKLLPMREEGSDWIKPLETIIEEICGLTNLLDTKPEQFFSLVCKLEGLFFLTEEKDFPLFRRTIFDCLSLLGGLKVCQ